MTLKLYEENSIQAVADAIREKNGSTDTYTVSEMATAVSEISASSAISPAVDISKVGGVTTLTITDKDGTKTATINDGADGAKGDKGDKGDTGTKGADGKTPVKGTDYFTEADKQELIDELAEQLGSAVVTVGDDNTITVIGDLDDGTYTVSYRNADGTASYVGSLVVGGGSPSTPTLTGLKVVYDNSTAVEAGTALSALTEAVYAIYSDGSRSAVLTKGTDYTLSDNLIAGQTNTITVTGKGTYSGFSTSFSVTVQAESVAPSYTNLVPTSLDPSNLQQVFNSTGYMDGARMSYTLSSGVLYRTDNTSGCCTGYIPYTSADKVFYIKADSIAPSSNYTGGYVLTRYANDLDSDTSVLTSSAGQYSFEKGVSSGQLKSAEKLADNYYKITIADSDVYSNFTYKGILFNCGGSGANLIVSKTPIA